MCRIRGRLQHCVNLHALLEALAVAWSAVLGGGRQSVPPLRLEFSLVSGRADFVAGAALCEPPCADFVAGTALCEPPCAEFVAGTALCEPSCSVRGFGWPSWGYVSPSWPYVVPSGPMLGPSWAYVGPSWAYVRPSWGYVSPSWTYLGGLCWLILGYILRHLR